MILTYCLAIYIIIALGVGLSLLRMFIQDDTASITDKICWIVLIGTALFWPIVLPISLLEKVFKNKVVTIFSKRLESESDSKLNLNME